MLKEPVGNVYVIELQSRFCQLLSAVENPTSTTALKRSPYSTVNQRSLKEYEDGISLRRLRLPETKPC